METKFNLNAKPRIGKGFCYHEEEFNLSKEGYKFMAKTEEGKEVPANYWYSHEKVKEFIKRLKEIVEEDGYVDLEEIDKLAGEKLI